MNARFRMIYVVTAALAVIGGGTLLAQDAGKSSSPNDKQLLKLMTDHGMTLSKAISAAEHHSKGQAISATAQMQGSDGVVNVVLVNNQTTEQVSVDIKTGSVREPAGKDKSANNKHEADKSDTTKSHTQPKKKP